jgi:hypothetical protein
MSKNISKFAGPVFLRPVFRPTHRIELNPFCAVGETRYKFRMELSINTIKIVLLAIGSGCFYT